jgi:hypothetical protein
MDTLRGLIDPSRSHTMSYRKATLFRSGLMAFAAFPLAATLALAQPQPQPQPQPPGQGGGAGGEPRRPPKEAIEACRSVAAGKACSFTSPQGILSGTCWAPEGKPLACKPEHLPGEGAGKPARP